MLQVSLHDGSAIEIAIRGSGPAVLLSVNPVPVEGPQAEELRKWGVDPALGQALIDGLSDRFRVVAFDYEGQVMARPKPDTLTPSNMAADFLAIADAVGADRFAWYGYSWLALAGLQLAVRTDRLSALMIGGFPPIGGPYREMLAVTTATHALATATSAETGDSGTVSDWGEASSDAGDYDWSSVEVTMTEAQTRQFVTLYRNLQDFDDRAAQARITCPRLCFAGSADTIDYGERWGNVRVSMADAVVGNRAELESLGWDVRILNDLDHTQAMQPGAVLPVLAPWLASVLG